jgi:hypothetical protein
MNDELEQTRTSPCNRQQDLRDRPFLVPSVANVIPTVAYPRKNSYLESFVVVAMQAKDG